ncbi:MAG: capsular biosynthesis protein [Elusimicrobiota bacterium]
MNAKKILNNPSGKLIAVDLDGTLCEGEFWGDGEPAPKKEVIDKVWKLYKSEAHIVIYTARKPDFYKDTMAWLIKYGVPFHGISMQYKPGADLYIDDKAISLDCFMEEV